MRVTWAITALVVCLCTSPSRAEGPPPQNVCLTALSGETRTRSPDGTRDLAVNWGNGEWQLLLTQAVQSRNPTYATPYPYTPLRNPRFRTPTLVAVDVPAVDGARETRTLYFELGAVNRNGSPSGTWVNAARAEELIRAHGLTYSRDRSPDGNSRAMISSNGVLYIRQQSDAGNNNLYAYPRMPLHSVQFQGDNVVHVQVGVPGDTPFSLYYQGFPSTERPNNSSPLARITPQAAAASAP